MNGSLLPQDGSNSKLLEIPTRSFAAAAHRSNLDQPWTSRSVLPAIYRLMHAAPSQLPTPDAHEGRRHERTHLFLAASVHSKAGSCPVHVRNISASGALIEGSIVPNQGDRLILKRGSLQASASIVWKAGRKAGIAFSSVIPVADWMARQPSAHQGRVDEMIQVIRSGGGNWADGAGELKENASERSLETELRALRGTLTELETGLLGDVILIATHPEIQLLDIALQAVDRMLDAVRKS